MPLEVHIGGVKETRGRRETGEISVAYRILLSPYQGMGRRTRVVIESMEEKAAYIPGVRGLGRDAYTAEAYEPPSLTT